MTTNQAGRRVRPGFDAGWWWAARLASFLVIMAALAYAASQFATGTTRKTTAQPLTGQEPQNLGYGVGEETARGSR
jgi:hypothetical protein